MRRPWRDVTYWLAPLACLVCFLIEPMTTSPGMPPSTTNWENVVQLDLMEAFPQLKLLSLWQLQFVSSWHTKPASTLVNNRNVSFHSGGQKSETESLWDSESAGDLLPDRYTFSPWAHAVEGQVASLIGDLISFLSDFPQRSTYLPGVWPPLPVAWAQGFQHLLWAEKGHTLRSFAKPPIAGLVWGQYRLKPKNQVLTRQFREQGEMGVRGDGGQGRWGSGEMGVRGDGGQGRWGAGEMWGRGDELGSWTHWQRLSGGPKWEKDYTFLSDSTWLSSPDGTRRWWSQGHARGPVAWTATVSVPVCHVPLHHILSSWGPASTLNCSLHLDVLRERHH
jgi:hypothetical protein